MEAKWIKCSGSSELIVFFCGWGFDERCVAALDAGCYDVVVLYDYRSLNFSFNSLSSYDRVTVVAWSFGVWVAAKVIADGSLIADEMLAINGTLTPVSETEGIPVRIFEGTLAGLSPAAIAKFNMRICGGARQMSELREFLPLRDYIAQHEELVTLSRYFSEGCLFDQNNWSKALISSNDLIFPYANMKNHWGDKASTIDGAHLCFGNTGSWNRLLQLIKGTGDE